MNPLVRNLWTFKNFFFQKNFFGCAGGPELSCELVQALQLPTLQPAWLNFFFLLKAGTVVWQSQPSRRRKDGR